MTQSEGPSRRLRRRRRENVEGGRQHQFKVLVTDEEREQLLALAAAADVSVQRLLVAATLAGDRGASEEQRAVVSELFRAVRQLAGIATNVNQVARQFNVDGTVLETAGVTLEAVRRCALRIESAIDDLAAAQ